MEFDFSYLPGKRASLSENYKQLILKYFEEFPLWGSKRIKRGFPYITGHIAMLDCMVVALMLMGSC